MNSPHGITAAAQGFNGLMNITRPAQSGAQFACTLNISALYHFKIKIHVKVAAIRVPLGLTYIFPGILTLSKFANC